MLACLREAVTLSVQLFVCTCKACAMKQLLCLTKNDYRKHQNDDSIAKYDQLCTSLLAKNNILCNGSGPHNVQTVPYSDHEEKNTGSSQQAGPPVLLSVLILNGMTAGAVRANI